MADGLMRLENGPREGPGKGPYLEALLAWGLAEGLVDRAGVERVQAGCLSLLAEACNQYTGGQSCSLPREQAEEILRSILFTLGLWLKGFSAPRDALAALGQGVDYAAGLRRVQSKTRAARQFWRLARRRFLDTGNELYNGTLLAAIPGFFTLYEPRFGAHRIHITADYPALLTPEGEGVEFIQAYAQALDYENRFCLAFGAGPVKQALTLYAIEYGTTVQNLYANLAQVVLAAALGCVIAGEPPQGLVLPPGAKRRLGAFLARPDAAQPASFLLPALEGVMEGTGLPAGPAAYMRRAVVGQGLSLVQDLWLLAGG